MKYLLIGAIILLAAADIAFWGGPSKLGSHLQEALGNGPREGDGVFQTARSIGGMISDTARNVANAAESGGR